MALRSAPQSLRRKLLTLVLATVVWTLAAEVAYRVYRACVGRPYGAEAAEVRLDELIVTLHGMQFMPQAAKADRALAGIMIHPYQGYNLADYTLSGQSHRSYFATPEADSCFDLVLIGGSVAAEFGNYSSKFLVPVLQSDPRLAGRKVRLHNVACQGHKQPQHTLTLHWLLSQGWKPDGVLLLDGFNELAVAAENASAGISPLFPYWIEMQLRLGSAATDPEDLVLLGRAVLARDEAEVLRARFARWPMTSSALAGSWEIHALEGAVRRAQGRIREIMDHDAAKHGGARSLTISGPPFDHAEAAVREQSIEAWREGSRSMQALCRARGIPFLHVLQPTAGDSGSKPLTSEEAQAAAKPKHWADAIARGYPRLRQVGAELAAEGVQFLDATGVFAGHGERIYRDNCHFGDAGCAILGPLVAEAFLRAWKP
jgi:hypothetical protein